MRAKMRGKGDVAFCLRALRRVFVRSLLDLEGVARDESPTNELIVNNRCDRRDLASCGRALYRPLPVVDGLLGRVWYEHLSIIANRHTLA